MNRMRNIKQGALVFVCIILAFVVFKNVRTVSQAKFVIGDRVITILDTATRATPSLSATNLGTHAVGSLGTVTGGPTTAEGGVWWQINYDTGADGWSGYEDRFDKYADTTSPTVSITTPTVGATLTGTVNINATAADNVAVAGVQFILDGVNFLAEDTTAPYSVSWDTTTATNATHSLIAVARDTSDNTAAVIAIVVIVNNVPPPDTISPTVSLTSPLAGAILLGSVPINATAADNVAVAGVQFKLDGLNLGAEDTTAPYGTTWNTASAANGSHNLIAVARDTSDNTAAVTAVNVTVNNVVNKFVIGDRITTILDTATRATPSLSATNLGTHAVGSLGTVTGGPTTAEGGVWWQINYDTGADGWSGYEDRFNKYTVPVPTFDFSMSNGGPRSVVRGASVTNTVTAALTSGSTAPVSFSASGLPSGASASFSPVSCSPTCTSTLTITTTSSTPVATSTVTITGTGGSLSRITAFTLTVTAPADITSPTVSITSPLSGTTLSGTVPINANAADNVAVAGVQFKLDGLNFGAEDTTAPYSISWDTTTAINAAHSLTAVARDTSNNTAVVVAVNVTVNNVAPPPIDTTSPTVSITSPLVGATLSGTVNINATAADNVAVAGVQFILDGVSFLAEDTTAPYSVSWNTTTATNGSHNLIAVARDTSNNTAAVTAMVVNVSNITPPPPGSFPWSGIIGPTRATNWNTAGVYIGGVAGIPNRTTVCANIAPYNGSAATINNAISNCPAGQVVQLGAGTFNLSTGIDITKSNVTLRGAGANATHLNMSGNSNASCHWGLGRVISLCTNDGTNIGVDSAEHTANWTGGFAKGSTVITVSNTTGLAAGSTIWLDQLDDTADYPAAGDVRVCEDPVGVCGNHGGGEAYVRNGRGLTEGHVVTAISGNNVTIEPGVYMPTFRTSQSPGAWWGNSGTILQNTGIENLSVNLNAIPNTGGIYIVNGTNVWIKGVRIIQPNANSTNAYHISTLQCVHCSLVDNYLYGPPTSQIVNTYGFALHILGASLVQNNILHGNSAPIVLHSAAWGNVLSYNYFEQGLNGGIVDHAVSGMNLLEGNNGASYTADIIAATHNFTTLFRNHFDGRTHNTTMTYAYGAALGIQSRARFFNLIGNVLGSSNSSDWNDYEALATGGDTSIFELGWQGTGSGTSVPNDARVPATTLRWGNWDSVTSTNDNATNDATGTRFASSEVPSAIANYSNPVPGSQALPASFYLSSRPSWFITPWGTPSWPAIGPDVSGGNISNSPTGGHANKIPARLCFENSVIDPAFTGTPRAKIFNADTCY